MVEQKENWKQFQGTELGSLMNRLYGSEKTVINYPKPKQKKFEPPPLFIPGGASATAEDPRKHTIIKPIIDVPIKPKTYKSKFKPVDLIPHRKSESVMKKEIE